MIPGDKLPQYVDLSFLNKINILVRVIYLMLNNLHGPITSWFTGSATKIKMLRILTLNRPRGDGNEYIGLNFVACQQTCHPVGTLPLKLAVIFFGKGRA